jgi:hypothetical protein
MRAKVISEVAVSIADRHGRCCESGQIDRFAHTRLSIRHFAFVFGLVLTALLASGARAQAQTQRGHAFAFSFGGPGQGSGQFRFAGAFKLNEAAGIAVDEATGDVYVVDRGNDRIEQFHPKLGAGGEVQGEEFAAAWGFGVSDGKEEYELCIASCRAGLPGSGKGQLKEAGQVAFDNSPGGRQELYVDVNASAKRADVERFPANGEKPLGRLPVEEEGRLDGIATDRRGDIWLYRGEEEESAEVEGFSDAEKPQRLEGGGFSSPLPCPKPGFGVDGEGDQFYLAHELLTGEGECPAVLEREALEEKRNDEGKLARPVVTAKLSPAEALEGRFALGELERHATTAIAVDQASSQSTPLGPVADGDVYLDEGDAIAAFTPAGELIQRFGSLGSGAGIAIDSQDGDVFAIDQASDQVDVFSPETQTRPSVEGLGAENLAPGEVKLAAKLDPKGLPTHYYFQYGTVDCANDEAACTDLPAAPGQELSGSYGAQNVTVTAKGLAPSSTYYYRLLAKNADGSAEGEQRLGTITTLPSSQPTLADGRAWELVSPPDKDGAGIEAIAREGSLIQAAANGDAITYVASGPVVAEPQGNRSPEPTQVLSTRSQAGWSSEDLITSHEKGEGIEAGEPSEFRAFSADLALSALSPPGGKVEPDEAPPLASGASEKTIYERDDPPLHPEGEGQGQEGSEQAAYTQAQANASFLAPGYEPLLTPALDTAGTRFGGQLEFLDASENLGHVVFESGEATLLQGSAPGLYEWGAQSGLQLVSILPDGQPAGEAADAITPELGDEDTDVRNAISADGSRVIFYSAGIEAGNEVAEFHRLYMRDTESGETLQLNAAQGVEEPVGEESQVAFQGASADGSKVFFTDTAPLTPESAQRPVFEGQKNPADLYECEVTELGGRLACELKDITPNPAGSGEVLNVLSGISEDGSSLYFVANGVLAPGASQGNCEAEGTPQGQQRCNLYLFQEGALHFIASLSGEDSGDWGSTQSPFKSSSDLAPRPDLADLSARVSPNGRYFAFMSEVPLTGYDNEDRAHPGVLDQEVYLYDSSTHLLSCVSCNASGPSSGVLDTEHSGEGLGLLVDRRGDFAGQYLAGSIPGWMPLGLDRAIRQPRYLSDSGRLFFDSPDQLVSSASNAKEDVYEYEPDSVGSCNQSSGCIALISSGSSTQESAFLEASESGDDAFFLTSQPLVAADHDNNFDVYDARVCTSESPCLSSETASLTACESTSSCKPAGAMQTVFGAPPTGNTQGVGNIPLTATGIRQTPPTPKAKPLTRAQKLAKALKACHKDKRRPRREACERAARRRYKTSGTGAKHVAKRSASRGKR